MTTAAAGIWNHTAAHNLSIVAKPQAGAASGDSGNAASTESATISANDFLTLLVTELQNQDPTAQTDPNEYVNQLVAVNSLEQLININQTLGTALGGSTTGNAVGPVTKETSAPAQPAALPNDSPAAQSSSYAPGNLAIPHSRPAARQLAQALSGRTR